MKKKLLLTTLSLFLAAGDLNSQELAADGYLRLFNYHLQESLEVQYKNQGQLQPQALQKINYFLRSRDNGEVTPIDLKLIQILDHLQDHFGVDTVEIISGYRRPAFNQQLKNSGRKVSSKSLHRLGQALDIHLDEIREETLRDYLLKLKLGGVGYYGPLDFVHIDVGEPRYWGQAIKKRKIIGVLDKKAPIQLTSDKNDYLPGDSLYFSWTFSQGASAKDLKKIKLEQFYRGQWISCAQNTELSDLSASALPTSDLSCHQDKAQRRYGKYRWVYWIKQSEKKLSSNEFYLKKQ